MIKHEDPQSSGSNGGSVTGPTRESTKNKAKVLVAVVVAVILVAAISTCVRNNKQDAEVVAPAAQVAPTTAN